MASAFPFPNPSPSPKLHITTSSLAPYIDPSQPPIKRSPFRQTNTTPFISSTTLILPDTICSAISSSLPTARYAKLHLTLSEILTSPFFSTFIKTPGSNILLLSEGTTGVDDRFSLSAGVLKLELCKETYEKCGLQGKPIRSGGRKHIKARYEVEFDLRKPEIVKGKKGFERLLWAAREVLNSRLCWLMVELGSEKGSEERKMVLREWHPTWMEMKGSIEKREGMMVPEKLLRDTGRRGEVLEEEAFDIVEWLDLVALGSPRVDVGDKIDPYISRYSVPEAEEARNMDLVVVKWEGLLSSVWVTKLLIEIVKQSRKANSEEWVALSFTSHQTDAVGQIDGATVLLQPDRGTTSTAEDDQDTPMTDTAGKETLHGLQRSMCFQFVDSNTQG